MCRLAVPLVPTFYVQTLASTGSAKITETVAGYNPTIATIDFTPSGFIVQGGGATTTFSGTSPVTVTFAQLDPTSLAFTGGLTLRPGLAALSVGLTKTDTPAGVGSLASASIVFNSGDSYHSTTYQPTGNAAGTSVIAIARTLPGYAKPSDYATTTFTVTAPNTSLNFCNGYSVYSGSTTAIPLGYNSSCASSAYLYAAAPAGGRTITLTSSDSTKLLLSTGATAVGKASITLTVAAGSTSSAAFYVQSKVSTASATITETVSGYNPTTATINFVPSGFIVEGGTATTTFSGSSPVNVYFAQLDPTTLDYTGQLTLRPGLKAVTVKLIDTNTPSTGTPPVGSLAASSLTFNPGDTTHTVNFQPAAAGTAVISFGTTPRRLYRAIQLLQHHFHRHRPEHEHRFLQRLFGFDRIDHSHSTGVQQFLLGQPLSRRSRADWRTNHNAEVQRRKQAFAFYQRFHRWFGFDHR
jgi:hypothetical protein